MTWPDMPVWAWLLAAALAWLVAVFVRWWWTHRVLEHLARIATALERQASPPQPAAPTPLPPQATEPEIRWGAVAIVGLCLCALFLAVWLSTR